MNYSYREFTAALLIMIIAAFQAGAWAGQPDRIWLAEIPEEATIDDAWGAGAEVYDRFPGYFVIGDRHSATALQGAGFAVEGPVELAGNRTVTLLHAKVGGSLDAADASAFDALGVSLLWSGDQSWITESDGPLPPGGPFTVLSKKNMRDRPIRRPIVRDDIRAKTAATTFQPIIQEMVDQVDSASYMQWIGNLAGANPVTISGSPFTFTTRYTTTAQCDTAERYVYERFQAMGYADVQFDPFSFSGTNARNIVATLPGAVTPDRIYILCGHLDATSGAPTTNAPGANDNASGTAAVLEAAEILVDYQFESTIIFIAFTGEEQGLYGSEHYAAAAAAAGDSILGVVNCDMIAWWNNQYRIDIEGDEPWAALMTVMDDACTEYTSLQTDLVWNSWGSDHVPFQQEGFPAFLAIETEYAGYPCYHQTCDTADNNDGNFGVEVTRACLATVAHLAKPRGLSIAHTPLPSTDDQTGPYEVVARITSVDPLIADSLLLYYSTGGAYTSDLMTANGQPDSFHAYIPGQPANTTIDYYLTAADSGGRHADNPAGAPGTVHSFLIGSLQLIFFEDFEGGGAGWTHGGTNDEWQVGAPQGLAEDPSTAWSGTNVYGQDLTGLGANPGEYEPNSPNPNESHLLSPMIDCTDYSDVKLSLRRWLAVEKSNGRQWDYAEIYANAALVWESPSAANLIDTSWVPMEIDISPVADNNPIVQIVFMLTSDISITYGGWNIDDVTLTGIGPGVPTGVAAAETAPRRLVLHANSPNPFNPLTTIRFDLPLRGRVDLSVYDVGGRLVKKLVGATLEPGAHQVTWDGRDSAGRASASGVYFYRLEAGADTRTKKMLLIR